ncbi:MAG: hypothetical protein K5872_21115 [Rhizobiaceae bacterium]|nr:hypothetical protein [Rhizobiaceae bacterium]MCV0408718.1 hypothetical protein [Rhizobiaceae bacterium]
MENQNALLWEVSLWEFLFVTVALGGGGAWLTGRALARTWQPEWKLAFYVVLLTGATRFIHFALFQGTLLTPWYFVVDLIVLMAIAFLGMRYYRADQMGTRYGFLYRRVGPLGWARKDRGEVT